MKTCLLPLLLATSLISGASAATVYHVSSNITGAQFWMETADLLTAEPGGYFAGLRFSGTATDVDDDGIIDSSNVAMDGVLEFHAAEYGMRQTYLLRDGQYSAGLGTVFKSGWIINETNPPDNGVDDWYQYSSYDAATDWLEMYRGLRGHDAIYTGTGSQTTAGLLLAPGTTALPGLWNGVRGSAGYNNAVTEYSMYGLPLGLYLQGTVTLTAVPVPATAAAFASGLLALTGLGRTRRRQSRI